MLEFKCTVVTPQGALFSGPATSVTAPGIMGQLGILARHENMVTILGKGIIKVQNVNTKVFFAVNSGSLEVESGHDVVVLADKAIKSDSEEEAKQKLLEIETASH